MPRSDMRFAARLEYVAVLAFRRLATRRPPTQIGSHRMVLPNDLLETYRILTDRMP
jgi:hypothetical protein